MGAAENWQEKLSDAMKDLDVVICNPRRDNWDSSWEQRASNPMFSQQVNWELDHLENADIIVFYFDPETKSPITLMELGLMAGLYEHKDYGCGGRPRILVCCPDGFWRKGNVEIVCSRANIPLFNTFGGLVDVLKATIRTQ